MHIIVKVKACSGFSCLQRTCFVLLFVSDHPHSTFQERDYIYTPKVFSQSALHEPEEQFIIMKASPFWDFRQKVKQVAGTSPLCQSKCQRNSSDIWSWAPTFSQAFPKSTFDELPQLSILSVPSGAVQSVLHGNVIRQDCNYWHCSNHRHNAEWVEFR